MGVNPVARNKYEFRGPLDSWIGRELSKNVGGDPDGVYLYAESGEGWVGPSVFKDEGAVVRYFDNSMHLCDLIMETWEIEEPGKRWAVMEYTVTGTSFDVKFKYPEEIDQIGRASCRDRVCQYV